MALDAELSVERVSAGSCSSTIETKNSSFFLVLSRLKSFGTPIDCCCVSFRVVYTPGSCPRRTRNHWSGGERFKFPLELPKQHRVCSGKVCRYLKTFCLFPPFPDVVDTLDQLTTQFEKNRINCYRRVGGSENVRRVF